MDLRTVKCKKARSGTFLAFWVYVCIWLSKMHYETPNSYQKCWLISGLRLHHSMSCFSWAIACTDLMLLLTAWDPSLGFLSPTMRLLGCWSLQLCQTQLPSPASWARLPHPASWTLLSDVFFLTEQHPWALLHPTFSLTGACGHRSLWGIYTNIDKGTLSRQSDTAQRCWR